MIGCSCKKISVVLKLPTLIKFLLLSENIDAFFHEHRRIFFTCQIFLHNWKIVIPLDVYFCILLGFEHGFKKGFIKSASFLTKSKVPLEEITWSSNRSEISWFRTCKVHHNSDKDIWQKLNLYQKNGSSHLSFKYTNFFL